MNSQYISIKELSAQIGKSPSWVYSKIGTGEIPSPVVIGKTKRWDSREVEKWLKGLTKVGDRKARRKRGTGVKKERTE